MLNYELYETLRKKDSNITKHTSVVGGRTIHSYVCLNKDKDFWQKDWDYQECNGITFCDDDNDLISRPLTKIYTLNENPTVLETELNWDNVEAVTQIIEGCMIAPIVVNSQLYFKTKTGITEETKICQDWYENHPKKEELRKAILRICRRYYTPIFQFVYQDNHTKQHIEPRLYFITMRGLILGDEIIKRNHPLIKDVIDVLGYDIKFKFQGLKGQELLQAIKKYQQEIENESGVIVFFKNRKKVKCLTNWINLK